MIPQIAVEANVSTTLKLPSTYKQEIVQSYYQKMCIGKNNIINVILRHIIQRIKTTMNQPTNQPVSLLSCAPKAITGRAEAKKIYVVGANILSYHII